MALRVIDNSKPPNGGRYRYKDPETGIELFHPYISSLKTMAAKHRRANNLPIPTNWNQFFETNICTNTATAECEPEEKSARGVFALAKKFTEEMVKWSKSGFDVVSKEVLQYRYDICQGNIEKAIDPCQYWGGGRMFGYGKCGKCGCSALALYVATKECPAGKWPATR